MVIQHATIERSAFLLLILTLSLWRTLWASFPSKPSALILPE